MRRARTSPPILFADYGVNMVSSGIVVTKDLMTGNPDLIRRFMAATTQSVEAAEKAPAEATAAVLAALPKAGKPDTLQEGFERTIPLYRTEETKAERPFHVTDANMAETVKLLVDYGGVSADTAADPKAFYTNEFLPK